MRQQALARGFQVLELTFDFPRSTAQELADRLRQRTKVEVCDRTVYRILASLQGLGYVSSYRAEGSSLRWRTNCKITINLRENVSPSSS